MNSTDPVISPTQDSSDPGTWLLIYNNALGRHLLLNNNKQKVIIGKNKQKGFRNIVNTDI